MSMSGGRSNACKSVVPPTGPTSRLSALPTAAEPTGRLKSSEDRVEGAALKARDLQELEPVAIPRFTLHQRLQKLENLERDAYVVGHVASLHMSRRYKYVPDEDFLHLQARAVRGSDAPPHPSGLRSLSLRSRTERLARDTMTL